MRNNQIYNKTLLALDKKLLSLFDKISSLNDSYIVYVFGDHGTNKDGNHGNIDVSRGGSTFLFSFSNKLEFQFPSL